jgi:hypothetical protein
MPKEIIFPDEPLKIGNEFYLPFPYTNYWFFNGEVVALYVSDDGIFEFGFRGFC